MCSYFVPRASLSPDLVAPDCEGEDEPSNHAHPTSPIVKSLLTGKPIISRPSFSIPALIRSNFSLSSVTSQCAHRKRPDPRNRLSFEAAQTAKSEGSETVRSQSQFTSNAHKHGSASLTVIRRHTHTRHLLGNHPVHGCLDAPWVVADDPKLRVL